MISIKNIVVAAVSISAYLFTTMGVGRYACHCDHASQIAVFGILTKCSCTAEFCHKEHEHKCICGAHLEAKQPKKDDCCAVSYFFLKADQDVQQINFDTVLSYISIVMPQEILTIGKTSLKRPLIKNFQALFRSSSVPIFEKNRQLIL